MNDSDGSVHVQNECNTGEGTFVVSRSGITLASLGYTDAACDDGHVRQVMNHGELTFTIDAARLTLMRRDIGLSARTE